MGQVFCLGSPTSGMRSGRFVVSGSAIHDPLEKGPRVNQTSRVAAGAVLAFVLLAGGWLMLPSMQGAQHTANSEAAIHIERGRRLLHQYSIELDHNNGLLNQMGESGVDVDLEDLDDLLDDEDFADGYQEDHAALWASYQPTDWQSSPPRVVRSANYGSMASQIRQGIGTQDQLLDENDALLNEALKEINEALAVSVGDASSRNHSEANRLKGIILAQKGEREALMAQIKRSEAEEYRQRLLDLASRARVVAAAQNKVSDSGIEQEIETLSGHVAELESALTNDQKELSSLDTKISELEAQIAKFQQQADHASSKLLELRNMGIDFHNPDGPEVFRAKYLELSTQFRKADRQLASLVAGDFTNAHLEAGDDVLSGKFVEDGSDGDPSFDRGVESYRAERRVLADRVANLKEAVVDARSDVARLEGMRSRFEKDQAEAEKMLAEATADAAEAFDELSRVESEAEAFEETATELLSQSASSLKSAAGYAKQWVSDARSRVQGVSSEAKDRSAYESRLSDDWLGGYISAQEADAHIQLAWIYFAQYRGDLASADVLNGVVEHLHMKEADPKDYEESAGLARESAVSEINQAMAILEKAHRDTGRHWTLVAQQATASDLLLLLDYENYKQDTIAAYRNATKGREDKAFVRAFTDRLSHLEN